MNFSEFVVRFSESTVWAALGAIVLVGIIKLIHSVQVSHKKDDVPISRAK